MSSAYSVLKRVAANASAAVSEAVAKIGYSGPNDEQLNSFKTRLTSLEAEMSVLKDKCTTYGRATMAFVTCGSEVGGEFRTLYAKSAPRQTQVNLFVTAQSRLDEAAFKAYSIDVYGTQILGVMDDWFQDVQKLMEDIRNAEAALEEVSKLHERVVAARGSKERRGARGEANPKEDAMLASSEELLTKYEKNFATQRLELEAKVNAFVDGRFAVLDSIFVRFMELQAEFGVAMQQVTSAYAATTSVYRKRYPLGSTARSPRSSLGNGSLSPSSSFTASGSTSPPPELFTRSVSLDPSSMQHQGSYSSSSAATSTSPPPSASSASPSVANPAARKSAPPSMSSASHSSEDSDEESEEESDEESEEESDSDDDDHRKKKPAPAAAKIASPRTSTSNLNTGGSNSRPSSPRAANDILNFSGGSNGGSKTDLFDIFSSNGGGGGNSNGNASTASSPKAKTSSISSNSDDPLAMFNFPGGGGAAAASSKPAAAAKASTHADFDPFGASAPVSKAAVAPKAAAAPAPISNLKRDASKSQLNPVAQGKVKTDDLDDHIAEQQESRLRELRENEAKADSDASAKKDATLALEDRLNAWSTKDGQRKNVRALLSTLQSVLWPNSGWKNIGLADLIDLTAIKKAHRKAILIVHPDKVGDGTAEQKVIAEHCFDALNSAFDKFQETGQ